MSNPHKNTKAYIDWKLVDMFSTREWDVKNDVKSFSFINTDNFLHVFIKAPL